MPDRDAATLSLINPLGAALEHYERALVDVLTTRAKKVECTRIDEPSANGGSRVRWLREYIRAVRTAGKAKTGSVIVLWPVLGYLDAAVLRLLGVRHAKVIMHDPTPLVRAIGYGRFSKLIARYVGSTEYITHSRSAYREVSRVVHESHVRYAPHPIKARAQEHPRDRRRVIRVLGQYKPSRDLSALVQIAEDERLSGFTCEIVGRGWPSVPGWTTDARFVPEAEMDRLILTSSSVVIPYSRFYQSGIAIRALELGCPVVGPSDSSLADIYGADAENLTHDGRWGDAVLFATQQSAAEIARTRAEYTRRVEQSALVYIGEPTAARAGRRRR